MKKDRTICDAIKIVLKDTPEGMTAEQIYKAIIENNLYEFNAENPQSVVVSTIRSSCVGVDNKFTTREKDFVIVRETNDEIYYALNQDFLTDDDTTFQDQETDEVEYNSNSQVNSWLLTWNPKNFDWENDAEEFNLDTMFKTVKRGAGFYISWRCVSTKTKRGDLVYFLKLGTEPKGIFASGYIIDDSVVEDNTRYAEVLITKAIDFRKNDIISQQTLKEMFPDQMWSPQGSGISIKQEAAKWLLDAFHNRTTSYNDESDQDNDNNSNALVIWKISHGTSQTGIPKHLRQTLENKKVVVVNQGTYPLASQKIPQGQVYMEEIKKGDFFYLCYAGEIVLFGQFTEDKPKLNQEMVDEWNNYDWYERSYQIIALSYARQKYPR